MLTSQEEAYAARRAGIHIIVVGLGTWTDENELAGMASHPYKDVNKMSAPRYEQLDDHLDRLRDLICNSESRWI